MEYKYCENGNFEDLASGRVIYGTPGVPNFPVRLGNEIYRRCVEYLLGKKPSRYMIPAAEEDIC